MSVAEDESDFGEAQDDPDEPEEPEEGVPESALHGSSDWFHPMPIAKLIAFGIVGGWLYCVYWFYENWRAYRRAWGYSREPFWRDVHAATGYRVGPFWRAVLSESYCFSLFPSVQQECVANRVTGIGAPLLLAVLFVLSRAYGALTPRALASGLISAAWPLVPVQLAINRLNHSSGKRLRFRVTGLEIALVVLGALLTWSAKWR